MPAELVSTVGDVLSELVIGGVPLQAKSPLPPRLWNDAEWFSKVNSITELMNF
jgi:hypothetical protein